MRTSCHPCYVVRVMVMLGLMSCLSGIAPAQAADSDPATWQRMVFVSYRDRNAEIYSALRDGTNQQRLTADPAADTEPRLNRGATQLVFVSTPDLHADIYRMDADGSHQTRLTSDPAADSSPAWSPDSRRIVFASARSGAGDIYVMNNDGSAQTRLTSDPAIDAMPSWSPDGRRIAWVRVGNDTNVIWTMNADGSDAKPATKPLRGAAHPVWSPDSHAIALDYVDDFEGRWTTGYLTLNDGLVHGVYIDSYIDRLEVGAWSPDGQTLFGTYVFYKENPFGKLIPTGQSTIVQVPVRGGDLQKLIDTGKDDAPDVASLDVLAPESRVKPLPAYSRAAHIPVRWGGTDRGGAGISDYTIQYQVGANGGWQDWQSNTLDTTGVLTGTPGTTLSLRSQARDQAYNVEDLPATPNGDTTTTLYTWNLAGHVVDNRDTPLPDATISVDPAAVNSVNTDAAGDYLARLRTTGTHTVQAQQPGYGTTVATLPVQSDRSFNLYLPPTDNLLRNGSFEQGSATLDGWTASDAASVGVTDTLHYSGSHAAVLGQRCALPCFGEPSAGVNNAYARMAVDSTGRAHVVFTGYENSTYIEFYTMRQDDGTWSTPVKLGKALNGRIAIDGRDHVHAVWTNYEDGDGRRDTNLMYSEQTAPGQWSAPVNLGVFEITDLVADQAGGVHLVGSGCFNTACPIGSTFYYLNRPPAGVWQTPIAISPHGYGQAALAVASDGTVHVVWCEISDGATGAPSGILYRARRPDGVWTEPELVFSGFGYTFEPISLALGPDGTLHMFWTWDYAGYYASRTVAGPWTPPQELPVSKGQQKLLVDSAGGVHLLGVSTLVNEEGRYYRFKAPEGDWSAPVRVDDRLNMDTFSIDRFDRFHVLTFDLASLDGTYLTSRPVTQASTSTLSQRIDIPADAHRPTLSFMARLRGATLASRYEVSVTNALTTTTVLSSSVDGPWKHVWADLSAWAGQPVTVTLTLQQAANAPAAQLALDDVSLGTWMTPIITSATLDGVRANAPIKLTIHGDNFIGTPRVALNRIGLQDVQVIDETTLQATLPATLPSGSYHVWVENPGGQRGVSMTLVDVGKPVYLPFITTHS